MTNRLAWFCVGMTIVLTVYGQLVVRMRAMQAVLPAGGVEKVAAILRLLADPWIASALVAAFLAAMFWIAAMTRLPLTAAYPFMSLPFVIVVVIGAQLLGEPLDLMRLAGIGILIVGLVVIARA